ncbi:MAG: 3-phosphoshikimate 1-carboxyvinyltransferase [Parvularculaceae bacterium]
MPQDPPATTPPPAAEGARATPGGALVGVAVAPGDKSISHRALIIGALAEGETLVRGLLEADDVLRTAAAMRALGSEVSRERVGEGFEWRVRGAPWSAPEATLYFGNAGTGVRLVLGAVAGAGVGARFDGDASLRARPMGRVAEPHGRMGAAIALDDGRLPATVSPAALKGIDYELPTPSAQVKSALLLAGLGAKGETRVREPVACRDHTERMLAGLGVKLDVGEIDGVRTIRLAGGQRPRAGEVAVPGDPSSAALIVAAAVVSPGSDVLVRGVLANPLRTGFFETLREMGADVSYVNERVVAGEPIADVRARGREPGALNGVAVPASRDPSMIDEYPALAVVAACARGDTYAAGVQELRVKETDRIDAVVAFLAANGVKADAGPDWLRVTGAGGPPPGGGRVETRLDHRIAMSCRGLGRGARAPGEIDDAAPIATSFPGFVATLRALGARID